MSVPYRPIVLVVIDGFGVAPPSRGNAIAMAKTPNLDSYMEQYPTVTLQAAGESVGLPWGEMGNSEVGHLSLGAGKIIFQDLPRITRAIVDGSFYSNPVFHEATERAVKGGRIHLVGMFSSAGVHAFDEHAFALMELCERLKVHDVVIHAILDGRDTAYNSGAEFIAKLERKIRTIGLGRIASVSGRYFAMDRDNRWDRTQKAYEAMVNGVGPTAPDAASAIAASYAAGVYDEQFVPTVITDATHPPVTIQENDAVIFFNYRPDRARQLTKAFVLPSFDKFPRAKYLRDLLFVTMTEYEKDLPVSIAFPPENIREPLAKIISDAGWHQLHVAETEKYAHVTFFFNGGREEAFPLEDRVLVPSPSVPSYDQKPDMSARELSDRVVKGLNTGQYGFVVVNFANPDMVGHTGNIPATIRGIETTDSCIKEIVDATLAVNGLVMITADHGNAEEKINSQTGEVSKEHSANPVPLIIIGQDLPPTLRGQHAPLRDLSSLVPVGVLADVAPTLLRLAGLPISPDMTGRPLFNL